MKTLVKRELKSVTLILDDHLANTAAPNKVWQAACYADSNCWIVTDVRLSSYKEPGPYATSLDADDFHSELKPTSLEEAKFIKSRLKSYREDDDGTIHWCSFDGMIQGHSQINGYVPPSYKDFHGPGYLSRREALEALQECRRFWENYSGDIGSAKLHNPNRQPTVWIIRQEQVFERALTKLVKTTP